jgi:hypothetical protein
MNQVCAQCVFLKRKFRRKFRPVSPQVSPGFAASCDESCDFKNATCANYLKNTYFVLLMANICSRNEVSSICALKPAQDSKYKKLARPQERKFRLFRASFVLAVLKYN